MAVPEFVRNMRAQLEPGHLLWLPGVNAVVGDRRGRVLLQQRHAGGIWSVPAGIIEPGEEPRETVRRELWEEAAIEVDIERLTSITVSPVHCYENGDSAQYLELTFRCHHRAGAAEVHDDESYAIDWFERDHLPPLRPAVRRRVGHAFDSFDGDVLFAGMPELP
ncbi:NUDIX domain-containing protein [Pseudonocardia sp. HH130629-09]|uniref:NUDIX domain-containing protein n=1 Tax=Pseudonocardia sp. HH130629-09 TaxID=1641402 RepID=UPI0006CB42A3|nr:NUDIX domain-containing protein [Pseudonocardia sp. HH130629-09]ALE85411.1 hypothetical protein XF36_21535 [Pseudonocardia sp. HH130629-09]